MTNSVFNSLRSASNNVEVVKTTAQKDQFALVWEFADDTNFSIVFENGTPFDHVARTVKAMLGVRQTFSNARTVTTDKDGNTKPLFKGKNYFPKRRSTFGLFYKGQVNAAIGGLEMSSKLLHDEAEFDNLMSVIGKAVELMANPEESVWINALPETVEA